LYEVVRAVEPASDAEDVQRDATGRELDSSGECPPWVGGEINAELEERVRETDGVRISSTRTSIFAPPYTFAVKLASKTTGSSVNWWVQVSIGENWPPPYESPRVSDAV
jgi:hypothetical protein